MSEELEVVDLGDATVETKQVLPIGVCYDNVFGIGLLPDLLSQDVRD